MRAPWLRLGAVALALAGAACGGASPSSGASAYLRVAATGVPVQFMPGELGVEDHEPLPTSMIVDSKNTRISPGVTRSFQASVSGTATAVLVGLQGDSGHWLIPVGGVSDFVTEGHFLATGTASFSNDLPIEKTLLITRAVDKGGGVGPAASLPLLVTSGSTVGALVIELDWDTEADLDLHVHVKPADGGKPFDVWAKAPAAAPSDSGSTAKAMAGQFQFDSNARCIIDGDRRERIIFDKSFPAGEYEIRVDTFSLCAEATARWHVQAYTNPAAVPPATQGLPTLIKEEYGQSIDRDTVTDHGPTAGLFSMDLYL